ncbi:helix-turn-helix transcriptional regulator [Algoriphagus sp.]|uniref:helix-turn-helix domain-containing protein n=1 Tax=Algoriphagus sp. TaxID=1872435 RepID=UPI0025CCCABD|nr:helix-turn-helix transcriptional regulator [Algoriphagus sp.]
MKQPELGKKISEMRKAKGLTQEELVEMCNLNVRTIQRIEAGEVTPRSYTIKALFEALGIRENYETREVENKKSVPSILYLAMAGGILYFFASIFEIAMEGEYLSGEYSIRLLGFIAAKSISFFGYVVFGIGWLKISNLFPNQLLKISFWIMIVASIIWYLADMVALNSSIFSLDDYYLVKVSSFGFCYVLIGFGFLAYKNAFSSMGMVIGGLTVVAGVLMFSGIGVFLALIPWTLAELLQIGLMVYLIQKIGRVNSPDFSV